MASGDRQTEWQTICQRDLTASNISIVENLLIPFRHNWIHFRLLLRIHLDSKIGSTLLSLVPQCSASRMQITNLRISNTFMRNSEEFTPRAVFGTSQRKRMFVKCCIGECSASSCSIRANSPPHHRVDIRNRDRDAPCECSSLMHLRWIWGAADELNNSTTSTIA